MKPLKLIILLTICFAFMNSTGCEERIAKAPQYIEAGKGIYDDVKDVDTSGNTANDIKNYVDAARDGAIVVGSTVPGSQGYAGMAVAGLTVISGILGLFAVKKTKQVKVEKGKSDNYRAAITDALADGDDQKVAHIDILKQSLDSATKTHFNETGTTKI